jgi:transcriptional regulator with XRE-family HTH domain
MTRQGGWPASGFGERLRHLREGAGLTQQQLAERAGCHYMTISLLERGTQEPAWPLVLQLADTLGVSTEDFRSRGDVPEPEPRSRGRPRKKDGGGPEADSFAPPSGKNRQGVAKKPKPKRPRMPDGG